MSGKPMLYTLRKHLKKSIFACCAAIYGGCYATGRFREYLVRREICSEASKFGEEPITALKKPRCMYVFLNPQANNGTALKQYEKDVAPVLHLAGIDVTLIKSDYEGHAKSLLGYIDPNVDGIIVAGGDGTILEVITGFIRLQDDETVARIPIGVVPLGNTNRFFTRTFNTNEQSARNNGNAAMAIIRGNTKLVDVIEIQSEGVRSTYALSGLCWGLFQEVKMKIDAKKHWWAGPWKKQMAFISRTVKKWPHQYLMSLIFDENFANNHSGSNLSKSPNDKNSESKENNENVDSLEQNNSDSKDGTEHSEVRFDSKSYLITAESAQNKTLNDSNEFQSNYPGGIARGTSGVHINLENVDGNTTLHAQVWKSDLNRNDFIVDGWNWIKNHYGTVDTNNQISFYKDEMKLLPKMNELTWYSIDGEEFEAKPVKIKILRNKLKIFC